MFWRVEIKYKEDIFDPIGYAIKKDIEDLNISSVQEAAFIQVYLIEGIIFEEKIKKICEEVLCDRVIQNYRYGFRPVLNRHKDIHVVEVAYNPGVMDPVEDSAKKAIRDLGIKSINAVKTAKKYVLKGNLSPMQLNLIVDKLLCNKVIQHVVDYDVVNLSGISSLNPQAQSIQDVKAVKIDILSANNAKLEKISRQGQLFLDLREMRAIKDYFKRKKRNPTDCELETIAQTWSEHCGHKTFRGKIAYSEELKANGKTIKRKKLINNLLKSTIMKVTRDLNRPWCVSVFQDNSGVIRFDENYNICFKVETHNHPSALEPYGGANTGIGGVIRDPLGTGLGAKPILNTDVFCFGPADYPYKSLPPGCLHPKRIIKGVVAGVRDYGNKMGIPTANGAVLFDEGFVGNPLVYCGTVGIMPKDKSFKEPRTGDLIVLVGGRTGRDGIHGATFSSGELTTESEIISGAAVQIGNPIQEKKMVDTILKARDRNLYRAITDCGGGGLSSAVGEMGKDLGVRVDLEKVPLKYEGLNYTEIWISEAQERMILSVPKENLIELFEIFRREDVEATVIGEFSDDKRLKLFYRNILVCDLEMKFLHDGLPRFIRKAVWISKKYKEPKLYKPKDLTDFLKRILGSWNVSSKEWIIRQYDHEVQGGSVLKPLVGINNDGPSDACVVKPVLKSCRGIAVSCGINYRYGAIDPYWMAAACIDEAVRQIIAVGGALKEIALLDNFCWGSPHKPEQLGSLVRCALGCLDTARALGTPFISGKDSLNNEYKVGNKSVSIPGTLLISAISVIEDTSKIISMDVKNPGNLIYAVGNTFAELGGSHYYMLREVNANSVPRIDTALAKNIFEALSRAIYRGFVASAHDCSEGGLGVAMAEMAFAGGFGMEIFLKEVPYQGGESREDFILFSESNSRFVVEVLPEYQKDFQKIMQGLPVGLIGCVAKKNNFKVYGLDGKAVVNTTIEELKESWQRPMRW